MDKIVVIIVFVLIGVILLINLYNVLVSTFIGTPSSVEDDYDEEEANPLLSEVRSEIDEKVRPHLHSIEGMYEKSEVPEGTSFSSYVLGVVKEKLSPLMEKDEKLVEEEIINTCSAYEGADCKENFCLEGSGISCSK